VTQGRIIGKSGGELPRGYWQRFQWLPHPELAMYSDQAHMIRDFKAFSGLTPVELLRLYSPEDGTIEV
jgi:hypothetical protein